MLIRRRRPGAYSRRNALRYHCGVTDRTRRPVEDAKKDSPADEVERQWATEIIRRAERALRGESSGRDADEVLASLERRLQRR
jgi:hypothetical protein